MNPRILLIAAIPALLFAIAAPAEIHVIGPSIEPEKPKTTTIYENKFTDENSAGPEWSVRKIDYTPAGKRPYLGGFVEEPVELSLKKLPQHKLVRITFDLFLLRCWDGSSKAWGVKLFELSVVDQQNLLYTTFSNAGFFSDNNEQAFPDTFPCRPLPAWTGASEKQTLGTIMSWGGPERTWDSSGVYHFVLTFPHDADDITFRYKATMEKAKDKTWGVTNLTVETISDLMPLPDGDLEKNWKKLGGTLSTDAYKALWSLTSSGDQVTDYIAKHLEDSCDAPANKMNDWILQLNTPYKPEIDAGVTGLIVNGKNSEKWVDGALAEIANQPAGDFSRRLNYVKSFITKYPETATELRNHRARQLLQIINTEKSRKLMEKITPHEKRELQLDAPLNAPMVP